MAFTKLKTEFLIFQKRKIKERNKEYNEFLKDKVSCGCVLGLKLSLAYPVRTCIFSLAVFDIAIALALSSVQHHLKTVTFCNISVITDDIYLKFNICSSSKELSIPSRETI